MVDKDVTSQVRQAISQDAFAILEIYNTSILTGISTGHTEAVKLLDVMEWLESMTPQRPFLVLEKAGKVIAWANADDFHGLPIFANCAEIGVYVSPEWQRQGIAELLLNCLEKELKKQGTNHLVALIFAENIASKKLFTKQEFQPWGVLPEVAKSNGVTHDIHLLGKAL